MPKFKHIREKTFFASHLYMMRCKVHSGKPLLLYPYYSIKSGTQRPLQTFFPPAARSQETYFLPMSCDFNPCLLRPCSQFPAFSFQAKCSLQNHKIPQKP